MLCSSEIQTFLSENEKDKKVMYLQKKKCLILWIIRMYCGQIVLAVFVRREFVIAAAEEKQSRSGGGGKKVAYGGGR